MPSNRPLFLCEPGEVYRGRRASFLTSHQLADVRWCPLVHRQKQAGLWAEHGDESLLIGAATHSLALEGQAAFEAEFKVDDGPINPKTGNPYGSDTKTFRDWQRQQSLRILTSAQYALVCRLVGALTQHDRARELLYSPGVSEGVLRTTYCGIACQVRVDRWSDAWGLLDLKTCASLDGFEAGIRPLGYLHQLAFYRAIIKACCGLSFNARLIAVEKQEPFRVGVWYLPAAELDEAAAENEAALACLVQHRRTNDWPTLFEGERIYHRHHQEPARGNCQ